MENKASQTALMAAFARAYHAQNAARPVFADTVVRRLLTDAEYQAISGYIVGGIDFFAPERRDDPPESILKWVVNTQLAPTPLARAKFCEQSLKTAAATGTTQYVIIGAGLDTFAWREPELMRTLRVFEVDHPLTQADKRARLARAGLTAPENLQFVPIDLAKDDLAVALLAAGLDPEKKTFFSWMGVSYYLTREHIDAMLSSIASIAAEGSSLAFDYADGNTFCASEKRVQNMLAMAAAAGEPMRFCADEPELALLLEKHNFLIYESLTPDEIQLFYCPARADGITAFEHICYALAVIKGQTNTREKISREALRQFAQRGYGAVSIKDLADAVCVSKGALYRHFKSKRDIFESVTANAPSPPAGAEGLAAFFEQNTREPLVRRALMLEQFTSEEYQRIFTVGAVDALQAELEKTLPPGEARLRAIELYAPAYLLFALCDAGEKDAPRTLARLIRRFDERYNTESLQNK